MTDSSSKELRDKIASEIGNAGWPLLESHAKRGVLILVDPTLELLEVALAVSRDDAVQVNGWMAAGQLTKPDHNAITAYESGPGAFFQFVVVQPFVLARPLDVAT